MAASPSVAPPEGPGAWKRVGEACGRALGVALLASVPAALRTTAAGGAFADGLLIAAAVLVPFVAAAILLSRAAARGFRYAAAGASPRSVLFGLALWTGLALLPIARLGAFLKADTHHRGLGGATFGALALGFAIVAALLARRFVKVGRRLVDRGMSRSLVAALGAIVAVVPMLIAAAPLGLRGGGPGEGAVQAAVLDGAIVLVATALAASIDLGATTLRLAGLFGLPLALLVLAGGTARIELSPGSGDKVRAGGGLSATVLGVIQGTRDPAATGSSGTSQADEPTESMRKGPLETTHISP